AEDGIRDFHVTGVQTCALPILAGVFMIIIQVLLGGITRLTGSGLSITEWAPIMGTIPPMNEADWNKAFEQYQQIAQFKYVNSHRSEERRVGKECRHGWSL